MHSCSQAEEYSFLFFLLKGIVLMLSSVTEIPALPFMQAEIPAC